MYALRFVKLSVLVRLLTAEKALAATQRPLSTQQCSPSPVLSLQTQEKPLCPVPADLDDIPEEQSTDWAPWTHRPFCADTDYCIYTNAAFQSSHGISLITTSSAAAHALPNLQAAFSAPALRATSTAPDAAAWEVTTIAGKGKGVVARRRIPRGEIFMVDYASVLADIRFPEKVKRKTGQAMLERAVAQLPEPEKVLELGRSSTAGAPVAEDVLRTNTFSATVDGVEYMALFPKVSRMNHACNPNAFTRFSEKALGTRVVAFRDIEPGEEITISYSEFGLLYKDRQRTLLRRWGFKCTCALCTSPKPSIAASDARRQRVAAIRDEVLQAVGKQDYVEAIDLYRELMDLVIEEQLVSHWGEHYEVLARLHAAVGDREGAVKYARSAVETLERFGGEEIYESIGELRGLLKGFEGA